MKLMGAFFILILSLASVGVSADQLQRPFTVKQIFAEGNTTAGFYPYEPLPECKWNIMYLDLTKESGKASFSLLIAAKAASYTIRRIDYTVSSLGTCLASAIHIQ